MNETEKQSSTEFADCLIITPFGEKNSETFRKANGLIKAIIEPTLKKFDLKPIPAHYIASGGSIPKQIIKHLFDDKMVIANLTGISPTVMYELAVRHATKKPVVIMAEYGTKLPFDINDQRTVFYHDTLEGVEDCKPRLKIAIEAALISDSAIGNPIYDVIKENSIIKSVETGSRDKFLIYRLDRIERMFNLYLQESGQLLNSRRKNVDFRVKFDKNIYEVLQIMNFIKNNFKPDIPGCYISNISIGTDETELLIKIKDGSTLDVDTMVLFISTTPGLELVTTNEAF